jgi:hypothetical protein
MIVTNNTGKTFTPPSEGAHDGVCCDVIDLGIVTTEFGEKRKCRIVFELLETKPDGDPQTVQQTFNVSLHAKSTLGKFLTAWRGAPISEGEEIDLRSFVGKSASLFVTHEESDGKIFANIRAVSKPKTKSELSGKYDPAGARVRIAERAAARAGQGATAQPATMISKATSDAVLKSFPAPRVVAKGAKDDDDVNF